MLQITCQQGHGRAVQERCVRLNCILSSTGLQGMLPHSQQYHLLPPIIRVTISRDVPINYGNIFISGTGREVSSGNAAILCSGGSGFEFRPPHRLFAGFRGFSLSSLGSALRNVYYAAQHKTLNINRVSWLSSSLYHNSHP